jgi:hypothetical protein
MNRFIAAFLLCMLLGCDAKKPPIVRPEAEIERLFAELIDAFKKGDDKKAASYFVSPLIDDQTSEEARITKELVLEETKRIGSTIRELPHGGNPRGCKAEGNFGVIIIETNPTGKLYPIYLRQTPAGWKFLSGLATFSNFSFHFNFVEAATDHENNEKINSWIAQQIGRSEQDGRGDDDKPSN